MAAKYYFKLQNSINNKYDTIIMFNIDKLDNDLIDEITQVMNTYNFDTLILISDNKTYKPAVFKYYLIESLSKYKFKLQNPEDIDIRYIKTPATKLSPESVHTFLPTKYIIKEKMMEVIQLIIQTWINDSAKLSVLSERIAAIEQKYN